MRGKIDYDGLERVTTQSLFDVLEVPQRSRTAGACRRLAAVMTELGWPKQVKRALAKIEAVFDFAKAKHWYFAENPARWKEKQKHLFSRFSNERVNYAALDYDAMPEYMRTMRQHHDSSVAAVALEFCILTTTRSGEVRRMKRSEIGLENQIGTTPKKRMKASPDHIVPLAPRAKE